MRAKLGVIERDAAASKSAAQSTLDLAARVLVAGYLVSLVPAPPARLGVFEAGVAGVLLSAGAQLGKCLDALRREAIPGPGAELLVVDDASIDGMARTATLWGATVIQGAGRGPAAARNLGASAARGEILVFLDADTAPRPGWLAALLAPFDDARVVAVKGRYHTRQGSLVARFAQVEFEDKYARLERASQSARRFVHATVVGGADRACRTGWHTRCVDGCACAGRRTWSGHHPWHIRVHDIAARAAGRRERRKEGRLERGALLD